MSNSESRKRTSKKVAYVDPTHPGIVRFFEGADAADGVLAGSRAQMIVDALNAASASSEQGIHVELAAYRNALEVIIRNDSCDPVQVAHEAITPYTPWTPASPETEPK